MAIFEFLLYQIKIGAQYQYQKKIFINFNKNIKFWFFLPPYPHPRNRAIKAKKIDKPLKISFFLVKISFLCHFPLPKNQLKHRPCYCNAILLNLFYFYRDYIA